MSASLSLGGLRLVCSLNTEPLTALPGTAGYQLAGQGRAALTVSSQWQQLPLTAHSFPPRPGWLCLLNISSLSEPQSIVIFALWPAGYNRNYLLSYIRNMDYNPSLLLI